MAHDATIPSDFLICPPLDYPLRPRGKWGHARFDPIEPVDGGCASDRFASVNSHGQPSVHTVHEALDFESGEGACVFAAYVGTVEEINSGNVLISHHNGRSAFASKYIHIVPNATLTVGQRVNKGIPIATVGHHDSGDHLHFELWHWVNPNAGIDTDRDAVPVDPTRLLYRWEQELELDYAVLGTIDADVAAALDLGNWEPPTLGAYRSARLHRFETPEVEVLAAGAVWRVTEGEVSHLLRLEGPNITVIDEAYGVRGVALDRIDQVGLVRRSGYPTFVVSAGDMQYAIPLHQATDVERELVALLRSAHERGATADLDIRRSPFWGMDGSIDDISAVIEGARVA